MAKKEPEEEIIEDPVPEPLIYCGPNLPSGALNQYTVFRSGLPPYLAEHVAKCPEIGRLCVPVESLTETMVAIQTIGSAGYIWYEAVVKYIQGGRA